MPILEIKKFLEALKREKVDFILVGGIAGIAHGMRANSLTNVVDICYRRTPQNYRALVNALKPVDPKLRTPDGTLPFLFDEKTLKNGLNFTLATDWGPIDLLGELTDIGNYDVLLPNAVPIEFYGMEVPTISLDELIKAKEKANRPKDQGHLQELKAIREIKRRSPT